MACVPCHAYLIEVLEAIARQIGHPLLALASSILAVTITTTYAHHPR